MPGDQAVQIQHMQDGNTSEIGHIPVLLGETLEGLGIGPGSLVIDGTLGGGGHTAAILNASAPNGRVLGLDADPAAVSRIRLRFSKEIATGRLTVVHSNFAEMTNRARVAGFSEVDAVLLDLGVSSFQLQERERGFSFQQPGPLDMRMNPHQNLTAAVIVNEWPEEDLANVLYQFGDERRSRRIAKRIVARRPVRDTAELAEVVSAAVGGRRGQRIHPATKTFQALRIAVNEELGAIEITLPQCLEVLRPGGKLAVISFHSLEDRIVKRWMQAEAAGFESIPTHPMGGVPREPSLRILTRKPIVPDETEVIRNPRSRSAKLRIAERISA